MARSQRIQDVQCRIQGTSIAEQAVQRTGKQPTNSNTSPLSVARKVIHNNDRALPDNSGDEPQDYHLRSGGSDYSIAEGDVDPGQLRSHEIDGASTLPATGDSVRTLMQNGGNYTTCARFDG